MRRSAIWRLISVFCIISISASLVFADNGEGEYKNPDTLSNHPKLEFRQVNWETTIENVKSIEKAKLISETSSLLIYEDVLAGLNVEIGYLFYSNKLGLVKYFFSEKHVNMNDYINDYNHIKETLIAKYGEPKRGAKIGKNDLIKNEPQQWGTAIAAGSLSFYSEWDSNNTNISLRLFGHKNRILHHLEYKSKKPFDLDYIEKSYQYEEFFRRKKDKIINDEAP